MQTMDYNIDHTVYRAMEGGVFNLCILRYSDGGAMLVRCYLTQSHVMIKYKKNNTYSGGATSAKKRNSWLR